MIRKTLENGELITLLPGDYHASADGAVLTTWLGSCAACLYDPQAEIIGMNHFLLSNQRYSKSPKPSMSEVGRYGVYLMELIINEMLKFGASRDRLKAKVFGGASLVRKNGADNFFASEM